MATKAKEVEDMHQGYLVRIGGEKKAALEEIKAETRAPIAQLVDWAIEEFLAKRGKWPRK
jgi:hypothetical protein